MGADLRHGPAHRSGALLRDVPVAELNTCAFDRSPVGNGRWKLRRMGQRGARGPGGERELRARPACLRPRRLPDHPRGDDAAHGALTHRPGWTFTIAIRTSGIGKTRCGRSCALPASRTRASVYIGWNHRNPLFQDVRVRRALACATDRQTIIDAFRGGSRQSVRDSVVCRAPGLRSQREARAVRSRGRRSTPDEAGWTGRDAKGLRTKGGKPFGVHVHPDQQQRDLRGDRHDDAGRVPEARHRGQRGSRSSGRSIWIGSSTQQFDATVLARVGATSSSIRRISSTRGRSKVVTTRSRSATR